MSVQCIQYLSLATPSLHSGGHFQLMCDSTLTLSLRRARSRDFAISFFCSLLSFLLSFLQSIGLIRIVSIAHSIHSSALILYYSKWNQLFVIIWDRFDKHTIDRVPFCYCCEREYVRVSVTVWFCVSAGEHYICSDRYSDCIGSAVGQSSCVNVHQNIPIKCQTTVAPMAEKSSKKRRPMYI